MTVFPIGLYLYFRNKILYLLPPGLVTAFIKPRAESSRANIHEQLLLFLLRSGQKFFADCLAISAVILSSLEQLVKLLGSRMPGIIPSAGFGVSK